MKTCPAQAWSVYNTVVADADITTLLGSWRAGDENAGSQVLLRLHAEIKRMAGILMNQERAGHTLQPTALVNELYLRMIRGTPQFADRAHFLAVATQHLRSILVDHARKKNASRRSGGVRIAFNEALAGAAVTHKEIIAVDDALADLARQYERVARVIELRYFGGLETNEVSAALGISETTVKRDTAFGRAWIGEYLAGRAADSSEEIC